VTSVLRGPGKLAYTEFFTISIGYMENIKETAARLDRPEGGTIGIGLDKDIHRYRFLFF
jgi:hypothetical protein